jgi:serine/threonine-protein kinase HipA
LLFSILIQNTDDHLRNHGFLLDRNGKWALSLAFDINPTPEAGVTLKTAISEIHGNELNLESAIEASAYFDVTIDKARDMAVVMAKVIKDQWRGRAANLRMSAADISRVAEVSGRSMRPCWARLM